jgi:hypothetical protein
MRFSAESKSGRSGEAGPCSTRPITLTVTSLSGKDFFQIALHVFDSVIGQNAEIDSGCGELR